MNPEIEAELLKVRERFERWARRKKLLKPGEALSVTFTIASAKAVVVPTSSENSMLDMSISEFFSDDRIRKAGLDPRGLGTRLRNLEGRVPLYSERPALRSVRDLQQIGSGGLKKHFRNYGAGSVVAIREVFKSENITWTF